MGYLKISYLINQDLNKISILNTDKLAHYKLID